MTARDAALQPTQRKDVLSAPRQGRPGTMTARLMKSKPKILIVEDEVLIAEYYRIVVEQLGYEVCGIAENAADAVELARVEKPAGVIMDVRLSGEKDGVDAAQEIYKNRLMPIIYVTASREPQTSQRISADHPVEVLTKPVTQIHLEAALRKHCPPPAGDPDASPPS